MVVVLLDSVVAKLEPPVQAMTAVSDGRVHLVQWVVVSGVVE